MTAKPIVRIVLLGVVAASVVAWALKEFGPAKTGSSTVARAAASTPALSRPDGVTVINFHGEKRCRTCIGIGNLAKKTLDEEFASEERAGKIRWEHINFDEPANARFVKDYGLVSSVVLVTLWKDGREVKWNRLDGVWDHYGEEEKFRAYVAQGVRDLLNQP